MKWDYAIYIKEYKILHIIYMRAGFNSVYKTKRWGAKVLSGSGSSLKSSENVIKFLVGFIESKGIRKIIDGSCGDCTWIMEVLKHFPDVEYIGNDISSEIIEINKKKYPKHRFYTKDLLEEDVEECDLFIFRHTMMHLSLETNRKILDNIEQNCRYACLTHHTDVLVNPEDTTRQSLIKGNNSALCWKKMNLTLPPFNLDSRNLVQSVKESSNNTNEYFNVYLFGKKK
tara:strand:+ start:17109 stop:17792 length:684 start_codon:yes stop_codon:yes gene_type:complete